MQSRAFCGLICQGRSEEPLSARPLGPACPCQRSVGIMGNFVPLRDAKRTWHLCCHHRRECGNLATPKNHLLPRGIISSLWDTGTCSPSLCLQAGKADIAAPVKKAVLSNNFRRRLSNYFTQISPGTLCEAMCTQQ